MKKLGRKTTIRIAVVVWCLVLVGVGVANRWFFDFRTAAWSTPVVLERPLSSVPSRIGSWVGRDVPINERVLEVAGTDDHVNRRYVNRDLGQVVDLYLAYTARPATMLGHRPRVCYPAHGWNHVVTKPDRLTLPDGTRLDCLIHHFTQQEPEPVGLVVLNYYVLQGRHTTEWTSFWGPKWRRPNLARDPEFYVAQLQITSTLMLPGMWEREAEAVKRFAAEVTPYVHALLPLVGTAETSEALSIPKAGGESLGPAEERLPVPESNCCTYEAGRFDHHCELGRVRHSPVLSEVDLRPIGRSLIRGYCCRQHMGLRLGGYGVG